MVNRVVNPRISPVVSSGVRQPIYFIQEVSAAVSSPAATSPCVGVGQWLGQPCPWRGAGG